MTGYIWCSLLLLYVLAADARGDERSQLNKEWLNTPPELTPEQVVPQARFLPFAASFSLSAGGNSAAHSLSIGAGREGVSLSHSNSASQALGSLAASQSSSFSAGPSGLSVADSNSFSHGNPVFGSNGHAESNSFSVGQASSSSHGNASRGQASSGAQTSVGSGHSTASSTASAGGSSSDRSPSRGQNNRHDYRPSSTPMLVISTSSNDRVRVNPTRGPIRLNVGTSNPQWDSRPQITVSKWNSGRGPHPDSIRPWSISDRGCRSNPSGCANGNREVPLRPPQTHHQPHLNIGINGWSQSQPSSAVSSSSFGGSSSRPSQPHRQPHLNLGNNGWSQSQPSSSGLSFGGSSSNPSGLQVNAASASSSSSSSDGGFSIGQSSSQSGSGPRGPTSSTINHVQTSGNGQGHAQGGATSVQQGQNGQLSASFSSGAISGSSKVNGQSSGLSISGNLGGNSRGQVNTQSVGSGSSHGVANSGSASVVRFPDGSRTDNVPSEFVRSRQTSGARRRNDKNPLDGLISDIEDTVTGLFDL